MTRVGFSIAILAYKEWRYYSTILYSFLIQAADRLCGLVVRIRGYGYRGSGFDSRRCRIFWEVVGLERGSLILVRITEELLERTVAAPF
jgi:hypothetical protein